MTYHSILGNFPRGPFLLRPYPPPWASYSGQFAVPQTYQRMWFRRSGIWIFNKFPGSEVASSRTVPWKTMTLGEWNEHSLALFLGFRNFTRSCVMFPLSGTQWVLSICWLKSFFRLEVLFSTTYLIINSLLSVPSFQSRPPLLHMQGLLDLLLSYDFYLSVFYLCDNIFLLGLWSYSRLGPFTFTNYLLNDWV